MEVKHDLQKMREATQDAGGEELEQSRGTDSEWCEPGPDTVLYAKHTVQQLVRKLPFKWVLIAAGAGVLLGAVLDDSQEMIAWSRLGSSPNQLGC